MQGVGMSDEQIVQWFTRTYGDKVYLAPPSAWGWVIPYSTIGLGLGVIYLFVRRYYKPRPVTDLGPMAIDDPALAKYKDQIEKDLANLE
jgi:cytochrome c-type biogenesis protein CcmH/NrfF